MSSKPFGLHYRSSETDGILKRIRQGTVKERLSSGDILYRVPLALPSALGLEGFTILHLSDLHFHARYPKRKLAALRRLADEEFDLVILTGDIIDWNGRALTAEQRDFLASLRGKQKLYILGNHDYFPKLNGSATPSQMIGTGFVGITNKAVRIERGERTINILGLDDPLFGTPDPGASSELREGDFNIVCVHNLDGLTAGIKEPVHLVLSGHTHAGEMNFFGLNLTTALRLLGHHKNLNRHTGAESPFRFLNHQTLSVISPGLFSVVKDRLPLRRFGTTTQGVMALTLHENS